MKKIIVIVVVLVVLIGGGVYYLKSTSAKADVQAPTLDKVVRGPVKLSVSSNGRVISNLDVDIKCKASGTIIRLPFDVSDQVKKGDLLLELDPVDEDRRVRQADVELSASKARLVIAQENLAVAEQTLQTDRQRSEAAIKSAEARAADARAKADRVKDLVAKKLESQENCETAETAAVQAASDLEACKVKSQELKTQERSLELKRQEVILAEGQVVSDQISRDLCTQQRADTEVPAPMDGVITARNVQVGVIISSGISSVNGGTTVLTLSDLSRIFVVASVDESDIGKIVVGQDALISVDAHPGKKFAGKVVQIAAKGVNVSNVVTFEVKIEVQPRPLSAEDAERMAAVAVGDASGRPRRGPDGGPRRRDRATSGSGAMSRPARSAGSTSASAPAEEPALLKPEMTANVEFIVAKKDDVLLAPADSIFRKLGTSYVTVPKNGATEERAVEVGISDGVKTEVLSGLAEGDTVIVRRSEVDSKWRDNPQARNGAVNPSRMMGQRR